MPKFFKGKDCVNDLHCFEVATDGDGVLVRDSNGTTVGMGAETFMNFVGLAAGGDLDLDQIPELVASR